MCISEADCLHQNATNGFEGTGQEGYLTGLLNQYQEPLMKTYLQSRGSDEEREKWGPWCGFGEGKRSGVEESN